MLARYITTQITILEIKLYGKNICISRSVSRMILLRMFCWSGFHDNRLFFNLQFVSILWYYNSSFAKINMLTIFKNFILIISLFSIILSTQLLDTSVIPFYRIENHTYTRYYSYRLFLLKYCRPYGSTNTLKLEYTIAIVRMYIVEVLGILFGTVDMVLADNPRFW